jgi:hypothetical protein
MGLRWTSPTILFLLLGYPVERIERDHKIEFFLKRQTTGGHPFQIEDWAER